MSTLAEDLQRYLTIRRSLGYHMGSAERTLRPFVAFANRQGVDHITTRLFLQWKDAFGAAGRETWAGRLGMVRIFAQWLNGIDPRNEVPPRGLIPARYRRARPYIYSDQEIEQILAEAGKLHSVKGLRGLTCSTLFGLIAVTGLRVSEAIALDNDDVDLVQGVLTIRRGKCGKTRLVPVAGSTLARLTAYANERDRVLGTSPQAFFVSERGTRPRADGIRYNFSIVSQRIGLRPKQRLRYHGVGPRIHDLRHTFAARTLINWYRAGLEPGREMIKLCTYLGHVSPEHTYWYIEAVPELLELAAERAAGFLDQEGGR